MKRIAWVKYNGAMEIGEHLLFTAGTSDIRANLFQALSDAGIQVFMYGPLTRETRQYILSKEGKKRFKNLHLCNGSVVEQKVDFLVVESGPSNTSFNTRSDGQIISHIAFTNRLIKAFEGLVFYLQIDLALPFIFFPEFLNHHAKFKGFKTFFKFLTVWSTSFPILLVKM